MNKSRFASLPSFALIIRVTTTQGKEQRHALDELHSRGLWLSREQEKAAGFASRAAFEADYHDWFKNRRWEFRS